MKSRPKYLLFLGMGAYIFFRMLYFNGPLIDDSYRLIAAINLDENDKYQHPSFNAESDSFFFKDTHAMWPIPTSYTLVVLTCFTDNYLLSYYAMELVFGLLLVFALWYIFGFWDHKYRYMAFGLLVFNPIFIQKCCSIDLYSTSVCTLGLAAFLHFAKQDKLSTKHWSVISILFTISVFFRFNFYSVAFAPFATLVLHTWYTRQKWSVPKLAVTLLIPLVTILVQAISIKLASDSYAYIDAWKKGFYITNLGLAKPYLLTLFFGIDLGYAKTLINPLGTQAVDRLYLFSSIIFLLELGLTSWFFIKIIKRKSADLLSLFLMVVIVFQVLPVIGISLYTKPLNNWTFIGETRYFLLATLCTVWLAFHNRNTLPKINPRSIKNTIMLIILLATTIHYYRFYKGKYNLDYQEVDLYWKGKGLHQYTSNELIFTNSHSYNMLVLQQQRPVYFYPLGRHLIDDMDRLCQRHQRPVRIVHYGKEDLDIIQKAIKDKKCTFDIFLELK